eukprot:GHVS01033835.1.p1 GENE.GHVS01033835.1~~GHVS01033835.1.p1  ORF type:complete len:503 (+),score=74.17 GHVS01033835.1:66-1574(+)
MHAIYLSLCLSTLLHLPSSYSAPFPVHSYPSSGGGSSSSSRRSAIKNSPLLEAPPPVLTEELFHPPSSPHLYAPAPSGLEAADTIHHPVNNDPLFNSVALHSAPSSFSSSSSWQKLSDAAKVVAKEVTRLQEVVLPARRVCEKGWMDSDSNACLYYDRSDKRPPTFTCPEGSVLDGDYCYGRIISDFEISCPKKFAANTEGLCVRAIVYSPSRIVCPEGFEVRTFTGARLKQCVKVMYVQPRQVPVENLLPGLPPPTAKNHVKSNMLKNSTTSIAFDEAGPSSCGGVMDKFCPLPPKTYTADKQFLLECPEGRLVHVRNTKEAVCRVRMVVPPDTRDTCKKGYSWTIIEGAGGACIRLTAFASLKVCPQPTPKFGPGLGDWETPDYHYDAVDRCVAYKAKAIGGNCPESYVLEQQVCLRKIVLPYYYDCNNVEGYGFRWNAEQQTGECVFEYDPFKWSSGVPYLTKRDQFDNARIQLFSNPYEVKSAYAAGVHAQAAALRGS